MREGTSGLEATARMPSRLRDRMHVLAVYGTFVLIAAVVFGTLSHHPF
jgi:hypothetical protein